MAPPLDKRLALRRANLRPHDWNSYLDTAPVASKEFMADVQDLPVQERGD